MKPSDEIIDSYHNNNIQQLSKGAINYLDNQFIKDGESRIIQEEFTFQVIYAMKKLSNWYCCSLMDQNAKYGGFCIKYRKKHGEPKKGDIIKTTKIQIVKLPNRETNLYFCEDVIKISESKKMILNPKIVESIKKTHSTSKKKLYLKYNIFQNIKEEENDDSKNNNININEINNDINLNSPIKNIIKNSENNIFSDSKRVMSSQKKATLISELTSFTNNPYFILKCIAKSEIKAFSSRYNPNGIDFVQNYVFSDINGDKIQATAYNYELTDDLNKMLKINSIYKISKAGKKMNFNKEFACTNCDIQLLFTYYTKFDKLENGEINEKDFKEKLELTKIKDLINGKSKIHTVLGILLEDKGIIEKIKINSDPVKYRRLIIGDDTLHRVSLKLWSEKIEPNRLYLKGDIICAKDVRYKQWNNIYELESTFLTKIGFYGDTKQGKALKKFYHSHKKIEEYKELNFVELDMRQDIKNKFILDYLEECDKEIKDQYNNNNLIKITGTVVDMKHEDSNVFSGCKFCYKKFENICPTCNTYNKKLFFDFNIKIVDCSNYMWINLFGETAENFLGINPVEYQILIKYNNESKLNEINKKILYQNFTFIGRYMSPPSDSFAPVNFIAVQYNKEDKNHFKNILNEIYKKINNQYYGKY
jgi:hypothetical protein